MAKKPNNLVFITPFVMLFVGFIAMGISTVSHSIDHLAAAMTRVEHPKSPDFSAYDHLLKDCVKTVDGRNLVDYNKVKSSPYLGQALATVARTATDKFENGTDKIAFYINTYNLLAIKCIADRFPVSTGKQTSADMHKRLFVVGGKSLSVDTIMRQEITPLLTDDLPREYNPDFAVFLLTRGTMGEPDITSHAITRDTITEDGEANMRRFIASKRNVYIGPKGEEFLISPWFQWQGVIFGARHRDLHSYVYSLLDEKDQRENSIFCMRQFHARFDWRINDIHA
ncbi:MAG: DUF547 domain-containing protein [Candidatus Obscuribacter sp.]|nr:DUF547 domain-containing protein [Candidatus Obscuribacter sp.]